MESRSKIRGKSVLVVDDSLQMQRLVRQILETHDPAEVLVASNGKEGLELMQRRKFDLVIADWLMPMMDGLTFVTKIREDESKAYARVPVVMLTGQSTASDVKKAVAVGINGYIIKPCSAKVLLTQVQQALP